VGELRVAEEVAGGKGGEGEEGDEGTEGLTSCDLIVFLRSNSRKFRRRRKRRRRKRRRRKFCTNGSFTSNT